MNLVIETKDVTPIVHRTADEIESDLMHAFEMFKEANDARIAELEAGRSSDPLLKEKLDRIEKALDLNQQRLASFANSGVRSEPRDQRLLDEPTLAHKAAFEAYVRKGEVAKLTQLEQKAMSVGSEADGGYLVPADAEQRIMAALKAESPIRRISGAAKISTATLRRPFAINGAGSGWVGETAARPQTATPALAELAFPAKELYAMPAATLNLLDDAATNIEEWIADEIRSALAQREGEAFVLGDGVHQPKGFLSYGTVPESSWTWGQLGYVSTGISGDFAESNSADVLIDLTFSLKSAYRANARFVMNRLTQSAVRKLKDGNGNYLWEPSLDAAREPTLLGYPVTDCDEMPDISDGSLSIAFGDFNRGYLVVDRSDIRVLRDPFSAKPYVLFYCTMRVGGGVQDFNAIKLLKFTAV